MRANATTTLLGRSALLVPYSAGHVEAYHSWMEDIGLREATASERLTLEEEREMQRSWAEDDASALFFFSSSFALSLPPPPRSRNRNSHGKRHNKKYNNTKINK